jgi:hypothetical protein
MPHSKKTKPRGLAGTGAASWDVYIKPDHIAGRGRFIVKTGAEFFHPATLGPGKRRCPNCGHIMRGLTWLMVRRLKGGGLLVARVCETCRRNDGLTRRDLVRGLWLRVPL